MAFSIFKPTPLSIYEDFKRLNNPDYPDTEVTEYVAELDEPPRCPSCGGWFRSRRPLPPLSVDLALYTPNFADVVFGVGGGCFLVSEKFKRSFEETDLTGLTFPCVATIRKIKLANRIRRKKTPAPPVYYLTYSSNGAAALDHEKSKTVFLGDRRPKCSYCRDVALIKLPRVVLEEGSWDGTDFFVPRGIGNLYVVSERFAQWFSKQDFTGAELVPIEKFSLDFTGETSKITNPNEILFDEEP